MNRTGRVRLHMGCGESLYSRWRICANVGDESSTDRRGDAGERRGRRPARRARKPRCTH
jgi:hypothetical protein